MVETEPPEGEGPVADVRKSLDYLRRKLEPRWRARENRRRASTVRLTMAQALVRFLANQYVERDGVEQRFFAGCFGIFGHGNVAGVGQALQEYADDLTYYQSRNEQAMVHAATAYARQKNRLQTLACTSSIGPGATNMVTGAALATINRLPVLLLPGDVFASRGPDPVLQQLETPHDGDLSVNDAFRPVSKYWDRINRPEQIMPGRPGRHARPDGSGRDRAPLRSRCPRTSRPRRTTIRRSSSRSASGASRAPLPDAGGAAARGQPHPGRPAAHDRGRRRRDLLRGDRGPRAPSPTDTGIPVGETQAGKGSMPYDHPCALGAVGADRAPSPPTASPARPTSSSASAPAGAISPPPPRPPSRTPTSRFVNVNVADLDAVKHGALAPRRRRAGHARGPEATPRRLRRRAATTGMRARRANAEWDVEVGRLYALGHGPLPAQSEVIGTVNTVLRARGRGRLRRRLDAGRPAQALADARPEGLPRRVRLLVHGVRDRRRARREDGRARARGLRHGRRRLVPDDERRRSITSDPGRQEADHRPRGQLRLLVHRRAHPAPSARTASAPSTATARMAPSASTRDADPGDDAARGPRGQRREPGGARVPGEERRRARRTPSTEAKG